MAVFIVDLLNLFYISLLHNPALTAAIGFCGAVGFVQLAVCIGLSIATSAVCAKFLGAGRGDLARKLGSSFMVTVFILTSLIGMLTYFFATPILHLFGAYGHGFSEALLYIKTVSPFLPLIALGMALTGLLRAVGDAKNAMAVTILGALATALFDPILIFGFKLGLLGAALSTVLTRFVIFFAAILYLRPHNLLEKPSLKAWPEANKVMGHIAIPAILTNMATPIGGAYITHSMAKFGLEAVAGQAVIDRITPVAFAFIFALTGSVGPIISQNYGAGHMKRVRETLLCSLKLVGLCVAFMWLLLALLQNQIIILFSATGTTAAIIHLFCSWLIAGHFFIGMLFVANVVFNNLGYPLFSTLFNWSRATLGTIPFVWLFLHFGPKGVLYGQFLGAVPFGICAIWAAFHVIKTLEKKQRQSTRSFSSPHAASPFQDVPLATEDSAMAELNTPP
ncbi:MatE [Entomobacter blattae]|uniref:MatE n=2 Tax=Entomobacter blattae TaxID=2762277 RepID=A0A7H1NPQ4_9PROT|nr:MatE [Entomobacter blattae]